MTKSKGWAVKNSTGEIKVETVSPTALGAMVSWLMMDGGQLPLARWKDDYVRSTFAAVAKHQGATLVEVEITEVLL